jgi:hypothetical protein
MKVRLTQGKLARDDNQMVGIRDGSKARPLADDVTPSALLVDRKCQ